MKRSRIKPMSDRRKSDLAARRIVVEAVLDRDNHQCQARDLVQSVKCGGGLHVHELLPRGVGGDFLDVDGCLTLCALHHCWVHDNTLEAERLGLLKRREFRE